MGLFSWKCAKSGIEITHTGISTPAWTKEVVLLRPDTHPIRGDYDGYGRVHTECGALEPFYEEMLEKSGYNAACAEYKKKMTEEYAKLNIVYPNWRAFEEAGGDPEAHESPELPAPRLILMRFYAGEQYEDVKDCEHAENQGHFLANDYADAFKERIEKFDKHGWKLPTFIVEVECIADEDDMDTDDRDDDPSGEHEYEALNEDEALDSFHSSVPIACLEHFEITTKIQK